MILGEIQQTNSAGASSSTLADDSVASPQAEAATKAIDASRQVGVINPGELANEVAKEYEQDPKEGAALHAAVNAQLSARDQVSLNEHLHAILAGVALARGSDRVRNTPQGLTDAQFDRTSEALYARSRELGLGSDIVVQGSRANGTAKPTSDLDLAIRVSPEKFDGFLNTQSRLASPNPGSNLAETRANAIENGIIQRGEARMRPTGRAIENDVGLDVDLSVVRRGGNFDQGPTIAAPTAGAATVHAAGQGALVGGIIDGGLTAINALRHGHITGAEAGDIVTNTARGATVGATYAVAERGLVNLADKVGGSVLQQGLGTGARVIGTRLAGAGAAGAVISAGLSIYDNREGLEHGDSKAIGRVASDVVVGAGSAFAGAAAGAAVGSVVPVLGTAVGAVVGVGVGLGVDYVARHGGVDKAISSAVSGGVDALKGAAHKVADWLG
jgi:hypothetical protein